MRRRADERILPSGNRAREHGYPYGQAEEAPVEGLLDVILRPALKPALGDGEPRQPRGPKYGRLLESRRQEPSTGEEE